MPINGSYETAENGSIAWVITDGEGTIRDWSVGAERLLGFSVEEAVGMPLGTLCPPNEAVAVVGGLLDELRGGRGFDSVLRILTKSGAQLAVHTIARGVMSGEDDLAGVVILLSPASSQPIDPMEHETQLRLMVENATEAILVAQDRVAKFVNAETERLLGHSADTIKTMPFVHFIHPDDRALVLRRHVERLAGDRSIPETYTFRVVTGHGAVRWVDIKVVLTTWEGRAATLNFLRDVTDRKEMEQDKVRLEEQLLQAQKLEALGTLAGGVAHDMNNILGAVMGLASTMRSEMESENQWQSDIDGILKACRRGRQLTRNLLGFARRGKYIRDSVSLNDVIIQIRDLLVRTVSKQILIETYLESKLCAVEGDPAQLHQALMNLCLNACEAMPGGGTLTLRTTNEERDDGHSIVRLDVMDTGVGMASEVLRHAFEPFFTTKPEGEGTGLGLSMVYGAVHSHGGEVALASELGRGTTVTVMFPVLEDGAARKKARRSTMPPPLAPASKGIVLVIDDEQMFRSAVSRVLKRLGYEVLLAPDGPTALGVYRERHHEIRFLVLDMVMPGMDGAETFRGLREIDPEACVLIASGFSDEVGVDSVIAEGAAGFIQKPFDLDQLRAVLEEIDELKD